MRQAIGEVHFLGCCFTANYWGIVNCRVLLYIKLQKTSCLQCFDLHNRGITILRLLSCIMLLGNFVLLCARLLGNCNGRSFVLSFCTTFFLSLFLSCFGSFFMFAVFVFFSFVPSFFPSSLLDFAWKMLLIPGTGVCALCSFVVFCFLFCL